MVSILPKNVVASLFREACWVNWVNSIVFLYLFLPVGARRSASLAHTRTLPVCSCLWLPEFIAGVLPQKGFILASAKMREPLAWHLLPLVVATREPAAPPGNWPELAAAGQSHPGWFLPFCLRPPGPLPRGRLECSGEGVWLPFHTQVCHALGVTLLVPSGGPQVFPKLRAQDRWFWMSYWLCSPGHCHR